MRVSRPNLINVALFVKFLVKSGELEFVRVTNDVENFHLQKRLKNSIEKATLMSLGIFREQKHPLHGKDSKSETQIQCHFVLVSYHSVILFTYMTKIEMNLEIKRDNSG